MPRLAIRLALIAIVAVAAFGAWWLWLRDSGTDAPSPTTRLYVAEQSDIAALRVTADGTTVAAFERSGDGWSFANEPGLPVNLDRWGGVVLLLSGPQVGRVLDAPDDLGVYGLDDPSTVIEVSLDGRDDLTVRLGDSTPDGQHYYTRVEGEDAVALVNAPWGNALRALATAPPYPYWFYAVDPELVRLFEVERDAEVATFLLGLPGDGSVSNRIVRDEIARDLTQDETDALMRIVGGPPGFDIADGPAAPKSIDPEIVIRLSYVLPQPLETRSSYSAVYRIGARMPNGAYLATTQDTDAALAFNAAWVESAIGLLDVPVE